MAAAADKQKMSDLAERTSKRTLTVDRRADPVAVLTGLRIAVALAGLYTLWFERPWVYGHLPEWGRYDTIGGWLIDWLPTNTVPVAAGSALFAGLCLLVAFGVAVRVTATGATLVGIWVLGVPQLFTPSNHYHHVIWLFVIVALSSGGTDRGKVDPEWWVRGALVVIGLCYLIPGLAKASLLPDWVTSDNLWWVIWNTRELQEVTFGVVPPRWLIPGLAAGAILFEVSWVWLAQTRLRRPVVAVAISFHLMTGLAAGIWFWWMVIVLVPFLARPPQRLDLDRTPSLAASTAGGALVVSVAAAGLAGWSNAWPVAQYPTFAYIDGPTERLVVNVDGEAHYPGDLLVPGAVASRRRKIERSRPPAELVVLVEEVTGGRVDGFAWVSVRSPSGGG